MGAYISCGAVTLALACEGVVIAGWLLAAEVADQAEARAAGGAR